MVLCSNACITKKIQRKWCRKIIDNYLYTHTHTRTHTNMRGKKWNLRNLRLGEYSIPHYMYIYRRVMFCFIVGMLLFLKISFVSLLKTRVKLRSGGYTVKCHYNAVKFIMVLYTALRKQWQKANQMLESQETPHGELWGVYSEDFGQNWSRYNGTTLS